jgi:hypothetical protein
LANPQNGWLDDEDAILVSTDVKAEPAQGFQSVNEKNIKIQFKENF